MRQKRKPLKISGLKNDEGEGILPIFGVKPKLAA